MGTGLRLSVCAVLLGVAMAGTALTAAAGDRATAGSMARPPRIYLVAPTRIDLRSQPNVVLTGQYLTPTTRVVIGGRQATTLEAPDPNHLLVKVPTDLQDGTYLLQASNGGATTTADDMITVQAGTGLDQRTVLIVIGALAILLLMMQLARFRTFDR